MSLEYCNLMSHKLQIVSSGESGRSSADDRNLLSGALHALRSRDNTRLVNSCSLQAPDVYRCIEEHSAAAMLTRMLADKRARNRKRIILSDNAHRVRIALCLNQLNICRYVNICRTSGNTRDRLCDGVRAVMLLYMSLIIFSKSLKTADDHFCRIHTEHTVCGRRYLICLTLDLLKILHGCLVIGDLLQLL